MKITFSDEINPYVEKLGKLSLNSDIRYVLKVGDTVGIECKFNGISISRGVVHAILEPDEELSKIIANENDLWEYTDEEREYIRKTFDHHDVWQGGRSETPCIVLFTKHVSEAVLLKKFNLDSIPSGEGELKWKGMTASVQLDKKSTYLLKVYQTAYLGWRAVISTTEIDELKYEHSRSRNVEGVAYSDDAIADALVVRLNNQLDEFCSKQTPDYHPGSGKVVRNLIHPSLYCYVRKPRKTCGLESDKDSDGDSSGGQDSLDFWGRQYDDSVYQWLPSEIDFSEEGKVQFLTYINNLDESVYPGIKDSLTALLETVMPMFELVCGSLRNDYEGGARGAPKHSIPLRGRRLQVITKVVEYAVSSEENFDGVWHVEGMSHEEIIATALCIVKRDKNFEGAEIEFRRFLYMEEADALVYSSGQGGQKATDIMDGGDVRPLGSLETPAGRVIVFPNSHIHRLTNMSSADDKLAKRRIVVFWLVNPDRRIISTQDIPRQQGVISIEDALRNRLALMAERKLHKQHFSEREVELCEH